MKFRYWLMLIVCAAAFTAALLPQKSAYDVLLTNNTPKRVLIGTYWISSRREEFKQDYPPESRTLNPHSSRKLQMFYRVIDYPGTRYFVTVKDLSKTTAIAKLEITERQLQLLDYRKSEIAIQTAGDAVQLVVQARK